MKIMISVVFFGEADGVGLRRLIKRRVRQSCGGTDGMEQMAADIAVRRYGRRTASLRGAGSDAPHSIGTPSDPSAQGVPEGPSRWALNASVVLKAVGLFVLCSGIAVARVLEALAS